MPRKSTLIFVTLSAVGLWTLFHSVNRHSSDQDIKHQLLMKSTTKFKDRHTDKVRGSLSAEVQLIGATPQRAGDRLVVKGVVQSLESFSKVRINWIYSSNLRLIQGAAEDLVDINQDKTFEREVIFEVKSAGPLRLQFHVRGEKDGTPVGAIGHWSNVPPVQLKKDLSDDSETAASREAEGNADGDSAQEAKPEAKVFH